MRRFVEIIRRGDDVLAKVPVTDEPEPTLKRVKKGDHIPVPMDFPSYAKLIARREQLRIELVGIRDEVRKSWAQISSGKAAERSMATRAEALIEGDDPENESAKNASERHDVLLRCMADHQAAIELLDHRISDERMRLSSKIRDAIESHHAELVHDLALAMIQLHAAHEAYIDLADHLNGAEVAWSSLHPMHPRFLGEPNRSGNVHSFLTEAVSHEFLSRSELPPGLHQ